MILTRRTRDRLYQDEELFNTLLPYVKWDEEQEVFLHSDASIWSIWELDPLVLTSISDAEAFQICKSLQELVDSLNQKISIQFSWITSYDVESLLQKNISEYPLDGPAGWMARRWVKMFKNTSKAGKRAFRPKKARLILGFRFDPPWFNSTIIERIKYSLKVAIAGSNSSETDGDRLSEYKDFCEEFKGEIQGRISRFEEIGMYPRMVNGQGLIDLLYPILNRRSTKGGKFRKGKNNALPRPEYDPHDILANQISDTPATHPEDGYVIKDGRVLHAVSMVKASKQALPMMTVPLQSVPVESIISATISRDTIEKQLRRLDTLDTTLGFREFSKGGRLNQKISQQIATVRAARQEIYSNKAQLVRCGLTHIQFTENIDDAKRAASEVRAQFPVMSGARGLSHKISDLGIMVNSLPGAYDPSTDGPGWTCLMRSSRAVRFFPIWGNWQGSRGSLILLPSLWNRELVGFDLYDSNTAPNVIVTGVSGAGKSYLLCFLIINLNRGHYAVRHDGSKVQRDPITFIFDKGMPNQPCGFEKGC